MKHICFKHLFTALLLLCATMVAAHDFEVDGIYYNILSPEDKTVEVTYKGTSSSAYSNEYTGSVVIPETVTVSETGTTVLKTYDAWTSTNKGNGGTTSQTSYTLNVEAGQILKFDWSVSSESNYDWLIITLDGTEIVKKSGTLSGSYEKAFDTVGSHTLVVKYTKDGSVNNGNDEGKIYNVTLNGDVAVDVEYRVTSIVDYAFYNCSGLTSVVIPNSVEKIGCHSFSRCDNLINIVLEEGNAIYDSRDNCNAIIETATNTLVAGCKNTIIPNSVTSIGGGAFKDCRVLTSIEIPNSVTSIGSNAFGGCTGLTSVVIGNSVTSIGSSAFSHCTGLTSVVIGNSVTSIGERAFSNCTGLTSITIPNSVTSIGSFAFSNCTGLTSITIPNSVTSIGILAFSKCTRLTSIEIQNSVTSIGDQAFEYCYGLKSVVIGDGVTSIGSNAFYDCYKLTSITIPNSVTSIGDNAFNGCTELTSIEIPNSVTSIGNHAFSGTAWYNNQPDGVVYAAKVLYEYKGTMPSNTSITIKDGTLSITGFAFDGCTGLTSVTIPNSVTSIGYCAFQSCSGLTSITSLIPADALFTVDSQTFYNVDKNVCTLYVPVGSKSTYASTASWSKFTNILELEPTEVTVTINQYGNATYCSPYSLDFSEVEGLKAYSAIGFNSSTQVVTLARVITTPAETGIFVKGEPGEYAVPIIEECNDHTLNLLVGTLEQTTVNSTDGTMSNYKFTIAEGDAAPMFYPFEDGTTLSGGKAYLQIPTVWLPVTAQKSLNIRFDEGETTDIDEVLDEVKGENGKLKGVYYDIQGRVVENPTSGLYILDGKKVLVK